jgi:hypothetical protein
MPTPQDRLVECLRDHDWQPEPDAEGTFRRGNCTVTLGDPKLQDARLYDGTSSVRYTADGARAWVVKQSAEPHPAGLLWWADFTWASPGDRPREHRIQVFEGFGAEIRRLEAGGGGVDLLTWSPTLECLEQSSGYRGSDLQDKTLLDSIYRTASNAIRAKRGLPPIPT